MKNQRVRKSPVSESFYQLIFMCPGCNEEHAIDARWSFNGDFEKPTFNPSVVVSKKIDTEGLIPDSICHSFVENGNMRFLRDCTHHLKGQTVDLPVYDNLDGYVEVSKDSVLYDPNK